MHVKELVIPEHIESASPQQVLAWSLEAFQPRLGLCTSFAAEGVVLIDMLTKLTDRVRVFTLDTGRLMPETYAVMEAIRERYDLDIEVFFPRTEAVEAMTREEGVNLFYRSVEARHRCCAVRKVEPLERALTGLDAWIAGLRRQQAATRTGVRKVEIDEAHGGIIKINPLADWTWSEVWSYIHRHDIPYNGLYDLGYSSIGCAPCTRAVAPGEDQRAGRWWWEEDRAAKECGLHPGRQRASMASATGS
jgi:phosphoadenosine phosphosulfate reductase